MEKRYIPLKIYCFYLYGDDINEKIYPAISSDKVVFKGDTQYTLYGYTNNNKYANAFKKSRKKNIFLEKIVHMTDDQYEIFKGNNLEFEILPQLYYTKTKKDGVIRADVRYIISTGLEYDKMCWEAPYFISMIFNELLERITYIPPDIFNNILSPCLEDTLWYSDVICWLELIDDIPQSMKINTFVLYFYVFGNTYDIERIDEACISTDIS